MQEILDMHNLHQHIYTQTHKLGNTHDWLISNTPNTIQDITHKDYLLTYNIIEWKFQISRKVSKKIQISKRDLTKINEENFNIDLKQNLETDMKKHSNKINTWMPLKTMDKHAPLITKMKTKKTSAPGSIGIHKISKHNEGLLRKDGSNLNTIRTS